MKQRLLHNALKIMAILPISLFAGDLGPKDSTSPGTSPLKAKQLTLAPTPASNQKP